MLQHGESHGSNQPPIRLNHTYFACMIAENKEQSVSKHQNFQRKICALLMLIGRIQTYKSHWQQPQSPAGVHLVWFSVLYVCCSAPRSSASAPLACSGKVLHPGEKAQRLITDMRLCTKGLTGLWGCIESEGRTLDSVLHRL